MTRFQKHQKTHTEAEVSVKDSRYYTAHLSLSRPIKLNLASHLSYFKRFTFTATVAYMPQRRIQSKEIELKETLLPCYIDIA